MEYIKKGGFGGGYRVTDETDCTHIALTTSEYNNMLGRLNSAEAGCKYYKELSKNRDEEKKEAERQLSIEKHEKRKVEMRLDEEKENIEKLEMQLNHKDSLMENLIRINREKQNVKRNIRPKKTRSGFLLISSDEKHITFGSGRSKFNFWGWCTVLQTPAPVSLSIMDAEEKLIWNPFWNNLAYDMGFTEKVEYDEFSESDLEEGNVIYDTGRRANTTKGYWELVIYHTRPILMVEDILPDTEKDQGD